MDVMSVARSLLLAASENRWLREHGTRISFVRRAVSVFMPGETPADMLTAAEAQAKLGVGALFTRLGENVTDMREADAVRDHYLEVIGMAQARGLACEASTSIRKPRIAARSPSAGARSRPAATSGWTWSSRPTWTRRSTS